MEKTTDILGQRKQKNEELRKNGVNLFPNDFRVENTVKEINEIIENAPETLDKDKPLFVVAGRMMAVNKMGKASFIRIKDRTGIIQVYVARDEIGADIYNNLFKKLDIGDFVGIKGGMFKTRTGEWTILAKSFELVAKSTRPLPEKFKGLTDPEKRYRRRYVDLTMSQEVREIFIKRSKIVQALRTFLMKLDFLEVETPMMQPIAGGAEATPFVTHHKALDMELYLRIAPELFLKRLVVGGFERVFEINRNFRNEGISTRHNPEFTMVEFYQAYANYEDLMDLTEEMFAYIAKEVTGSSKITYQGEIIDFGTSWKRINLIESLVEIGGLDRALLEDKEGLLKFGEEKGVKITKKEKIGKILTKLFDDLVEPKLVQPTFITGYPVEVSPLSRRNDKDPEFTERFELFIAGREIANGFSELNDPVDQRGRFEQQVEDKKSGNDEAHPMDTDYIEALEYGMPPTAGEGIGIDRLAMLLTDVTSIREVILFPLMKHQN
ncbi:MAG: lysine--tRNA ligase [Desulfobacterales bacterium]|nr:lysine--tRNA ligase [Desulfobacterales bacterium]